MMERRAARQIVPVLLYFVGNAGLCELGLFSYEK